MPGKDARVLFVCWGNICRSPAAEGLFRGLVAARGLADTVRVDSAGTLSYHAGEPPDARMREAAARRGYELSGEARQLDVDDVERFDLILAMDRKNLGDIEEICGGLRPDNVSLFSDFLPDGSVVDVPDPYYAGGFDGVLDLLEEGCPQLLEYVLDHLLDEA